MSSSSVQTTPSKLFDSQMLLRLWPYMRPHLPTFGIALAVMPLMALTEIGKPYLLKLVVDQNLIPQKSEGLLLLALAYFGLLLGHAVFSFFYTYLTQSTGQRALSSVRKDVFARYQAYSMADMDKLPVGAMMTRATTDIEALSQMFQSGLLAMLHDFLTMGGLLALLFYLHAKLAMIVVIVLPLAYFATDWFQKKMRHAFRIARERLSQMNAFISENISGIRVVHLFDMGHDHLRRFRKLNYEYKAAYHQSNIYDASLYSTMEFTGSLCVALFLATGAYLISESAVTLGVMVAFIESVGRFFAPLRDLSSKLAVMQASMAAAEKVIQVLDHVPEIREPLEPVAFPDIPRGEVRFEHVSFRYRDDTPVLDDVSLVVKPGEKVAIVGPTGAGKTTLIKLLERFYDPTEGRVLLDTIDLKKASLQALRAELAVVLQDVFLVRGSVLENVALGVEGATPEQVVQACKAVEADAFIEKLPGRYDAWLEEGASNLSSGEKQLLSFARALVRDPRVLILDEATSNVDVETEAKIQRAMEHVLEGRTAIIIAHRLSTIRSCDRIVVMQKGKIIESGSHRDLIDAGGTYSKLYSLQEKDGAVG